MENLIALIDKTKSLTQDLFDVLLEERQALAQQDISILEQVIEKKLGVAQNLQATEAARDAAQAKFGAASGQRGIEEILSKNPDSRLHDSWEALCEASQRCKEENLLVGTMIRKNQLATDQALQVLRKGHIDITQTYSASGTTAKHSEPKTLGKA